MMEAKECDSGGSSFMCLMCLLEDGNAPGEQARPEGL